MKVGRPTLIVGFTIPQAGAQDEIKRKVRGALAFNAFCFWKAEGIDQLPPILVTIPSPSSKITEPKQSLPFFGCSLSDSLFQQRGKYQNTFYKLWYLGQRTHLSDVFRAFQDFPFFHHSFPVLQDSFKSLSMPPVPATTAML